VHRSRVPFLPVFVVVSVVLHAAGLGTLCRPVSTESARAVEVSPLTGETVEIVAPPPSETADTPLATAGTDTPSSTPALGNAPAPSVPRGSSRRSANQSKPVASVPALFGAVGERSATDLVATFVRAFPQAASADPIWSSALLGTAGTNIALVLDDTGHLARIAIAASMTTPPSADLPSALRRGIDRTVGILGGRLFTSRGAVTRLRITARLSLDELHDGLHGDVFALSGGSFSGDVGSAFFALPSTSGRGRRVDVEFRILR
jgi:hypothetical protein